MLWVLRTLISYDPVSIQISFMMLDLYIINIFCAIIFEETGSITSTEWFMLSYKPKDLTLLSKLVPFRYYLVTNNQIFFYRKISLNKVLRKRQDTVLFLLALVKELVPVSTLLILVTNISIAWNWQGTNWKSKKIYPN